MERTFSSGGDPPEEQIQNELQIGVDYLDVAIGFLTRIQDEKQTIVHSAGDHPLLEPGSECPLEEAYCQRTIDTEGTLSVQAAKTSEVIPTKAVETFELGTYVGAKITINGDLYGTICFADRDERPDPFTETEELFVELLAERIGNTLRQQAYEAELVRRNDRLEAEKRRFEGITRASTDIIFRIDDTKVLTYVSTAAERLLGYEPEALIGTPFSDVVGDSSTEQVLDLYRRVMRGETVESAEFELTAADGTSKTFEINA